MPKTPSLTIPREILEQLYAEVETRVERKFEARIVKLERELEQAKKETLIWKKRYFREKETTNHLIGQLELAHAKIKELEAVVEAQEARIKSLQRELYGQSSEVRQLPERTDEQKRQRGKQPGVQGHGRKQRTKIEPVEKHHHLPESEQCCSTCGLAYEDFGTKKSEEIDVEFKVIRIIHHRHKIRKMCQCKGSRTIKIAPVVPKLFKRGLLSTDTWSFLLYDKYQLQRPGNRTLQWFDSLGLELSAGTVTNGFKKLHCDEAFKPIVEEIFQRVSRSRHQQKDETGWKVFQEVEGKEGYNWWIWVTLGGDCCYFQADPSRSAKVAKATIGENPIILTSDRFKAYGNLGSNVTNSWCWAHVRRALLELGEIKKLEKVALEWVRKVDGLYHLNKLRIAAKTTEQRERHHSALEAKLKEFERQVKRNSVRTGMHEKALTLFKGLAKDWSGLCVFLDNPMIPMDNNASERALRNPVVGRKNYYGSGAEWSAHFAADLFTIFATLQMNGVEPRTWLNEYLHAVARNKGRAPANATAFLPWNTPPSEILLS